MHPDCRVQEAVVGRAGVAAAINAATGPGKKQGCTRTTHCMMTLWSAQTGFSDVKRTQTAAVNRMHVC